MAFDVLTVVGGCPRGMTYQAELDRCYVVSTAAALPPTVDQEAAFVHCKSFGSEVNLVAGLCL